MLDADELDRARVDEAIRTGNGIVGSVALIAARLAREGWTPPVAVDPDIAEAWDLVGWRGWSDNHELVLSAIKRGRELERAVMGNPIPEQNQEVTPSVDPDEAEAEKMRSEMLGKPVNWHSVLLWAIKRGRALAAAEAKPGMVWVKHDGSAKSPVALGTLVAVKFVPGAKMPFKVGPAEYRDWQDITHYAIITPPEDK